ncbi:hypothetical protein [Pelagibacterium lacus]|uniref:Uncharacterized protein n=1 Tax=Pelagibacterium lacus TaxID=2282655 RepID=A0A369W0E5_9HYPH|nr:hypothetical protein [Pelagibacterium lacus]RDE08116.1 hypothetical protein DVH29_13175 [Pelagibacterium lacus]
MSEIATDIPQDRRHTGRGLISGRGLFVIMLLASLAAVVWIALKAFDAGYPLGAVALPALVGACCGAAAVLALRR